MSQPVKNKSNSEDSYKNIFDAASDGLVIFDIKTGLIVEANRAACEMHGYTRSEFIGLKPDAFMPSESHTLFMKHVQTVTEQGVYESLVVHHRKDGSPFHVEVKRTAINYRNRPCLLSIIRDVSQRIETESILSRQIEARLREQATLLAISHTLASTLDFQPGLILDQLREIIKYTHGGLFTIEESILVTMAMRGTPQLEQASPFHIRLESPNTLSKLFNESQPTRIPDVWSDDSRSQLLRSLLVEDAAKLLEGMQSWMWVPLIVKSRIIGVVGVAEATKNYFTVHHADLALSVANQAAITMINAELYGHAQELAVLEERQRLARNLHDAVNQSLFSAGLIAEVLPRLWDRDQPEARRSLEDLRRLIRGAMAEMRALLAELRPSTLTDADLGDLLRLLGNAFTGRTNIPAEVTVNGEASLPAETQVSIYRICQEALNNIVKHAKANRVEIDLQLSNTEMELSIRDDGHGFDLSEQIPSGHYGLGMMHERAEAAKVDLTINSQPGQGTEVNIHWKAE
jgi:two-component system nitrate/nitrite sensor histidine kinase NarX